MKGNIFEQPRLPDYSTHSPGLKIASSEYPLYEHEINSSVSYSRFIFKDRHETIVLVPKLGTLDTPGFDGFILDNTGHAIANYSLKSASPRGAQQRAQKGIKPALKNSEFEQWVIYLLESQATEGLE